MKFLLALAFLFTAVTLRAADSPAVLLGDRVPTQILRTMPSGTPPNQRMDGITFIAGYEIIGTPVAIPADRAAALAMALKDHAAFSKEQNEEKMRPGVAYRFGSGPTAVDVLVCFSCDKISLIPAGIDEITTTYQLTQTTRDALLSLAKELLPNDEAIQALPRVRSAHPVSPPFAPVPKDAPRTGQPAGKE
jgi:hypothetical protein